MQQLVQGAFQWDWAHAYNARARAGTCAQAAPGRRVHTTKAAEGHHRAAAARILAAAGSGDRSSLEDFKLSRFKRVAARTDTFRQLLRSVHAAA